MKKKKFELPLLSVTLVLVSGKLDRISKKYDLGDLNSFDAVSFFKVLKRGYTEYYIAANRRMPAKNMAHEAVHVVNFIYKHRGITLDIENDENQAYLTGWIVEKCKKFFK